MQFFNNEDFIIFLESNFQNKNLQEVVDPDSLNSLILNIFTQKSPSIDMA